MHIKRNFFSNRTGEIATFLTVTSLVVMVVGLFLGTTRKPNAPGSKAAEDCLYNATAVVVKGTIDGPLILPSENNYQQLSVVNNWGQEGFFVDTHLGYYYNFTQNPFTFGPYKRPVDKAYVDLKGLDESENGWFIKRSFCTPVNGGLGCGTPEDPIQTPPSTRISNFQVSCGVHMKYGWVVERKPPTPPILTHTPSPSATPKPTNTPTPTATATPTATPKATATPRLTPIVVPYKSPTPLASATPRPTAIPPTNTPTPIPTTQQAACNTTTYPGTYAEQADVKYWDMGNKPGIVYLSYNMYAVPDMLAISHENVDMYNTNDYVSMAQFNIPLNYTPKTSTLLKTVLTSNRANNKTVWWYALSCPKDPLPEGALCTSAMPTKTISGKVILDQTYQEMCINAECKVILRLNQKDSTTRSTIARGPDFNYAFTNVKIAPGTRVEVDSMSIPNLPNGPLLDFLPHNCFFPRSPENSGYGACIINMAKEQNCQATNVDFIATSFNRNQTLLANPLKAIDVNRDKKINIVDFALVLKAFGSKKRGIPEDINKDGMVNGIDLARVISNVSKTISIE